MCSAMGTWMWDVVQSVYVYMGLIMLTGDTVLTRQNKTQANIPASQHCGGLHHRVGAAVELWDGGGAGHPLACPAQADPGVSDSDQCPDGV